MKLKHKNILVIYLVLASSFLFAGEVFIANQSIDIISTENVEIIDPNFNGNANNNQFQDSDNPPEQVTITRDGETSVIFEYTGSEQAFTVPAGISSLGVTANGAQGGNNGNSNGGLGGFVSGDISVIPGMVLYVYVGGQNGYNGGGGTGTGGSSNYPAGVNGGGASDIRVGGNTLSDRVIVAGGGGGAGRSTCNKQHGGGGG